MSIDHTRKILSERIRWRVIERRRELERLVAPSAQVLARIQAYREIERFIDEEIRREAVLVTSRTEDEETIQ